MDFMDFLSRRDGEFVCVFWVKVAQTSVCKKERKNDRLKSVLLI